MADITRRTITLIFHLTLLAAGFLHAQETAWTPLLDRDSLEGWTQVIEPSHNPKLPDSERGQATFHIEDGVVIGRAENRSMHAYLCSPETYGDFELTGEVFFGWPETKTNAMNSGIQIRSRWNEDAPSHKMTGFQVDLDRSATSGLLVFEGHRSESIMEHGKLVQSRFREKAKELRANPEQSPVRPDEWNTVRIVAEGPRIQTFINDVLVEDYTDEVLHAAQPEGFIALQVHEVTNPHPAEMRWRKLRIRELDGAAE